MVMVSEICFVYKCSVNQIWSASLCNLAFLVGQNLINLLYLEKDTENQDCPKKFWLLTVFRLLSIIIKYCNKQHGKEFGKPVSKDKNLSRHLIIKNAWKTYIIHTHNTHNIVTSSIDLLDRFLFYHRRNLWEIF